MRSNSITKILKEDRDFSKAELASFPTDSFLEIDKCANKLDYEDLSELSAKALEITGDRENSVYARYVLGTIAFIRRPHEDNIIMQNLLISFYDNHNWTVVEFLCRKILSYSENKLALRILADCYEEEGRDEERWGILERLVKVDFEEKKITKNLADHFMEKGDKDKALLYYRRALTRYISAKDAEGVKNMWSVLLSIQNDDFGYFLGIGEKVSASISKALAIELLSDLYTHFAGDVNKSIQILKKALEIDPSEKRPREELIKVYRKKYEKSARLGKCIERSGLANPGEDVNKAISFFETDVGSFVYRHHIKYSGWHPQ